MSSRVASSELSIYCTTGPSSSSPPPSSGSVVLSVSPGTKFVNSKLRLALASRSDLPGSAGEVEMLLCLGRVGQYLVVTARDVERDVHGLFLFHVQRILNGYSTDD